MYDVRIGDRFYHNNTLVAKGINIPDYLIITNLIYMTDKDEIDYIQAKYCNHYVDKRERMFSSIILKDSNLNPECKEPSWIFIKEVN